jgi:hypothetical protein
MLTSEATYFIHEPVLFVIDPEILNVVKNFAHAFVIADYVE